MHSISIWGLCDSGRHGILQIARRKEGAVTGVGVTASGRNKKDGHLVRGAFTIVQVVLGIFLMVLILLQSKGAGLGSVFGGDNSVFRTRRGVERVLFNFTIGVSACFLIDSLIVVSKF